MTMLTDISIVLLPDRNISGEKLLYALKSLSVYGSG